MRIWSLHPQHLDRQGLTACWRESLLAQAVLTGRTRGYRHHPQLVRFRAQPDPLAAIGAYLGGVADEATARGYRFDVTKILRSHPTPSIPVTEGQVAHEWARLRAKLHLRSPALLEGLTADGPHLHPLFVLVAGPVEAWEVVRESG